MKATSAENKSCHKTELTSYSELITTSAKRSTKWVVCQKLCGSSTLFDARYVMTA
jgi:hypothetical protein